MQHAMMNRQAIESEREVAVDSCRLRDRQQHFRDSLTVARVA